MRAWVGTGTSAASMLPMGVSTVKSPYPPLPLPLLSPPRADPAAAAAVASERNSKSAVAEGKLAMTPLSTSSSTAESGRGAAAAQELLPPLPLLLLVMFFPVELEGNAKAVASTAVAEPPRTGAPPLPSRADSTNALRLRRASTKRACRRSRDAMSHKYVQRRRTIPHLREWKTLELNQFPILLYIPSIYFQNRKMYGYYNDRS